MNFLVVYALGLAFLLSVFTYAELAVSASTWKRTRRLAEFGAISNCSTTSCAQKNGDAFLQATRESKPEDVVCGMQRNTSLRAFRIHVIMAGAFRAWRTILLHPSPDGAHYLQS
jgi:hypothetical protein